MEKYRFPRSFMHVVGALAAGAVLFSLYRSIAHIGAPFLLLWLLAFVTSSRYSVPLPRGRGQISLLSSFVLLAILVFGGDAAIVFAAATAFCSSLSKGRARIVVLFEASLSALSAFLIVWAIRFTIGMTAEPGYDLSLEFFKALALAVLIQASVSTTLNLLNESYLIKESFWRKLGAIYSWTSLTYLAGAIAACLSAWIIVAAGNTALTVI